MQREADEAIFSRLGLSPVDESPSAVLVPVDEHVIFLALAGCIAESLVASGAEDAWVITDAHTMSNCVPLQDASRGAAKVVLFGGAPTGWRSRGNVEIREVDLPLGRRDHFLLVLSPRLSLCVVGTAGLPRDDRHTGFEGVWSCYPGNVLRATNAILGGYTGPVPGENDYRELLAGSMRMVSMQTAELAERQRDIALDRADLFAVLNILKAISANRRAHDVLYVFVEQIARVISTERCSVVRIWGEGEIAHVLASHEDESVSDHVLSLAKYPELRECLRTRDKVVIQNVAEHPLTRDCAAEMKAAGIGALLVLPIVLYDGEVGTLLLRAARRQGHFSLREVSFFEIVANAAANALERAQLFENVQQANERLERLAITDGLTGLYNRRHFREYFDAEIERALRYEIPMAVMLFDVDNFKYLNDTYGHLVGDNVLREIADRSIGSVRKTDFLARYGGEEFVIVMPQTDAHGAEKQAARLLTTISGRPFRLLPEDYRVTVSVGLTVLEPGQRGTAESLLKAADGALYQAKRAGKNRFVRATLEPDA